MENETLLGDLRHGLCSSGLCKQLRSVAADEIERLDADAAAERAEKESLAAIIRTRDKQIESYRAAIDRAHARAERIAEERDAAERKLGVAQEEIERLRIQLSHAENLIDFTAPLSCATHGLVPNLALFDNKCPACALDEARNALSAARHAGTLAAAAPREKSDD